MTAHTPGPWVVDPVDSEFGMPFLPIMAPHGKGLRMVCEVSPSLDEATDEFTIEPVDKANARLVAAAPAMLAPLEELIAIEGPQPGTAAWAAKVRDIIFSITGEDQ